MALPPDVPLAVVIVHLLALAALLTRAVLTNWQRLMLLRQNRPEVPDPTLASPVPSPRSQFASGD
jgi:hypothetical protein